MRKPDRGPMAKLNGAHVVVYSQKPSADREFLRDVLGLPHVDVGDGWLIFALPPAEVAIHPGEKNDLHEFFLTVDDLEAFVGEMAKKGIECAPARSLGWGILTQVSLPGGGRLGVYQPRHRRPAWPAASGRKTRRRVMTGAAAGPSRRPSVTKAGKRRSRRAAR